MDEVPRGKRLTSNLMSRLDPLEYFNPPSSNDMWGPMWAPLGDVYSPYKRITLTYAFINAQFYTEWTLFRSNWARGT